MRRIKRRIDIRRKPGQQADKALLAVGGRVLVCSVGRTGIRSRKREGDGATPAGRVHMVGPVFVRESLRPMKRGGAHVVLAKNMGWCDDPADRNYNRLVRLPYSGRHESLYRADRQYDFCAVLAWNLHPRTRNRGSAIFLHQTSISGRGTEGCVALPPSRIRQFTPLLRPGAVLHIHP